MTLIDDTCDGCGGRFDPMGDPLLTRHPEIGPWAVYCGSCEQKVGEAEALKALNKIKAEAWDEGYSTCLGDFDIAARREARSSNPYREEQS